MASIDPLARLVVDDEVEFNRELLASLLEGRIRLDPHRGTFGFVRGIRDGVSARQRVVTALLAQQALHLLEQRHAAGLAPREIEACTGIQGGTLRPILKRLADQGLLRKDDATGAYSVPGYSLFDFSREFGRGGAADDHRQE